MITFPMSDTQFAAASTALKATGIHLEGASGTIVKDGITANYTHANGTLTIEITDKPFFVPVELIEAKLKEYFHLNVPSA